MLKAEKIGAITVRIVLAAVGIAALASPVAAAQVDTEFEDFNLGTVDGQQGWTSAVPGDIPALPNGYDQAVVLTSAYRGVPAAFGSRSLRHSNAFNEPTEEFFYQTYSERTAVAAGEDLANTEYTAQFSFISTSPNAQQPGLNMRISPDNGVGGRMSFIGLKDVANGIALNFYDTDADGEFALHPLGTVPRDVVHTIRFWIKLHPGPANDLVRMFIDGTDVGQCFTTWESFYPRVPEPVPTINSLQFRASGGEIPDLAGGGYLFDNVTVTTGNGPGPEDCSGGGDEGLPDVDVDKDTQTRFARPGQLITYRITVTNRDDRPVRSLRTCDRAPRALRFVRATVRLRRATGNRRCHTFHLIRPGGHRTFRATFRLRANVSAQAVTNGASADIPTSSESSPSPPDGPDNNQVRGRVARDAATVGVLSQAQSCPAALRPRARAAC